ncbi:acyl-CoA reductase [Mycobacterium marseillense]|uniref:acyl-CoA reductase n=1 Tax=Mycobacterium marseillense TaxID=701042 RepID=UPI001F4F695F|nr:acyl-CoA reductase [Mycobacterium marseillense]
MSGTIKIPHIARGRVLHDAEVEYTTRVGESFMTPRLDLDELVWPRTQPGPAFDLPIAEVLDFLGETAKHLYLDANPYLREAIDEMASVSPHSRRLVENQYRALRAMFEPEALGYQVERELGAGVIDGWTPVHRAGLARCSVRAFPPRLVHVMAGNGAAAAAMSIIRGALTKGVNLLKLPSNDLCTATAILRTMVDVDPDHPTVRSFSAAYWRGGDVDVESVLYRPQYFDKLVAWGAEETIRHALRYVGPGFELVGYDPKVSISMLGKEIFTDDDTLRRAADLGAIDAALLNQEACAASRHQFVEGDVDQVDRYCELLAEALSVDRDWTDGTIWRTPGDIRDTVDALRYTGEHGIWGGYDGRGLVIRSAEPVDFHPIAKTVNVIPVSNLGEATRFATVATQTVGVHPAARKAELRDRLACAGVQRVVSLGDAFGLASAGQGLPHDGFYPLQRLMRWVSDEGSA